MDPLAYGNYPSSMRMIVGNRLPRFTKQESEMIKGAFDFIGLNYYTTWYSQSVPPTNSLVNTSYTTDSQTNQSGMHIHYLNNEFLFYCFCRN